MLYLRGAGGADLEGVVAVARHLDTVNLPSDEAALTHILEASEQSFSGALEPPRREFLFALVDRAADGTERVLGVSMIFACHGSRPSPHIYFDVIEEERYSHTLDRHFHHTLLRLGHNYRGVTEIGGLVVMPEMRGHPERLGLALSYVRFIYMARHRDLFRDEVISELMPPLEPDGTSLLWESLGRHFTGLSYQQADRLSRENKEFIRTLFPHDAIYTTLLPKAVQAIVGQVGPTTKPVERMLRRIGFSYANRIDPFDGGPHFHARTDDITVVRDTRTALVSAVDEDRGAPDTLALVAVDKDAPPFFKAVRGRVRLQGNGVALPSSAAAVLGVGVGDEVAVLPLESAP